MAYFNQFDAIAAKEIAPGFWCKLIHTGHQTINFLEVEAGSLLPMHQHPHEQCSFVLEGEFEMTINGETKLLTAHNFAVIPGNIPHGGRAITRCRLIDVFYPERDDYK